MKDNFSEQSAAYSAFRPGYPPELAAEIARKSPGANLVWDCATGNGQMAVLLAPYFSKVFATDLSARQLEHATAGPNIRYACEPAHQCSLPDHSADAIVVAQAIHWFNFDAFYQEVQRVARPGALFVVIGYPLFTVAHKEINQLIGHFYSAVLGPYWDLERKHLDADYRTIPIPFQEIPAKPYQMKYSWTSSMLLGYLSSWSAVQHFRKKEGIDPLEKLAEQLNRLWPPTTELEVCFRIIVRMAIV